MKKYVKILLLIAKILFVLFIIIALYRKIVLKENIKLFKTSVFIVNSGSMQPELEVRGCYNSKKMQKL